MQFRQILLCLFLPALRLTATPDRQTRPETYVPAPVSVSSANYAQTARDQLRQSLRAPHALNPTAPAPAPLAVPQRYVFMPGELYEADLTYEEICRRLADVLVRKGFINAVDDQQRVIDSQRVDLILRIHSGERTWRLPLVRTDQLRWRDGMTPRPHGRTLTNQGGEVFWDYRAGGVDDALGAAAANESAPGFGGAPSPPPTGSPMLSGSTLAQILVTGEYEATRGYYLIVVDAFSYADLRQKGANAERLWTTFVAAPRQPGQKFSDVLNTMLRVATPYFGETTTGLQMFNDARAEVILGEMVVLPEEPEAPAP